MAYDNVSKAITKLSTDPGGDPVSCVINISAMVVGTVSYDGQGLECENSEDCR